MLIIIYPHKIASFGWPSGIYTNSLIDGKEHRVISHFSNHETAADKLAYINKFNESLILYIDNKCNHKYCNSQQQKIMRNLNNRYKPESLIENDPSSEYNTSYTQFKGKIVAFCLREKDTGNNNFETSEALKFVSIHELAHISATSYGHNNEFWSNFKSLLHLAKEANIYEPVDYSLHPLRYCGVDVGSNPYFWN